MATLTSKLIVSLIDRVSGPSRAITARINALSAAHTRIGQRMDVARGRILETAGVAYGLAKAFAAPITAGVAFESVLEDIGQKAGLSGKELQDLGVEIRKIAAASNQTAQDTAKTFDALVGLGLGGATDAENVEAALKMMPAINKVATAYRAAAEDVARAGQAVFANLKVPAAEMLKAFDAMARAGKEGAFELADMARYFPDLTTGAQNLGSKGVKGVSDLAAALQVVRQGAGSAGEAATNLGSILASATAPVTQKAFEKFGVDFRKEMDAARKAGVSPIEAMAILTERTLKKGAKIGDLFRNQESQKAMLALLDDMPRYRKIRAQALKASGEVEEDFARRIKTAEAAMTRFKASIEELYLSLSTGLLPIMTSVIDRAIRPFVKVLSDFANANPALAGTIVTLTAGLIGLRIAAFALKFAFGWLAGGALMAAVGTLRAISGAAGLAARGLKALRLAMIGATMLKTVGGGGMFASFLAGLARLVPAITGVFAGLGTALAGVTAPVWGIVAAVVAVVVGLAIVIYKYWVPISNFVSGFVGEIWGALSELVGKIAGFAGQIASAVGGWATQKLIDFALWLGIDEATIARVIAAATTLITNIKAIFTSVIDWFKTLPSMIGDMFKSLFTQNTYSDEATEGFRNAGKEAGKALVDAIKSAVQGLFSWLTGMWGKIKGIFSSGGAGAAGAALAGARALGGPVRSGSTYLVGERGPELFTAGSSGMIHDTGKTLRAIRAATMASALAASSAAAPAAAQGGGGVVNQTISISVHAAPGQSPEQIAAAVKRQLSSELNALSRAAFSDGAN